MQDSRGRSLRKRGERDKVLKLYDESEMTQKDFAKMYGIKYTTFSGWLKMRRQNEKEAVHKDELFHQLKPHTVQAPASSMLELQLPNGIVLRGENPSLLLEFFKQMGSQC